MTTGWTSDQIDAMEYRRFAALLRYLRKHPPMHILLQGIASGLAGRDVVTGAGLRAPKEDMPPPVTDAEAFAKMMQGSGLSMGVISMPKSAKPVGVTS